MQKGGNITKREKYSKYIATGLTAFLVIGASLLLFFLFYNIRSIRTFLNNVVGVLAPFIVGGVIAYLLSPIYNLLVRNFDELLQIKLEARKARSLAVGLSVFLSILFALLTLSGIIALVLPGFITSMIGVISAFPAYAEQGSVWLKKFFASNPAYATTVQSAYDSVLEYLENWATSDLLPNLKSLSDTLGGINSLLSSVVNGFVYAFKILKNVLLGFIIAAYFLVSKTTLISHAKQLVYSIFSLKIANATILKFRYIHKVFGGFIRGKLLDSLIIGVLCFFGTSFLGIPFAMLVSVVVGITNIIPFFGPFIGAIPCAVLILLYSPLKCLYFVIFVFALQQFDGNILGPKILGDSTGLSSFWVLFAIIVFGGVFGFAGMLVGVPLFAVIYSLISGVIHSRLSKKRLSIDVEDYSNLSKVNQKAGTSTYEKMKDPTRK